MSSKVIGGNRSTLERRSDYLPRWPQDEFIVRLLGVAISEAIPRLAVALPRGSKALDLGCGRQPFRRMLEDQGLRYFSCDVDQPHGVPIDVVCRVDEPPPEALQALGPFDFILCTEVLEHVADWSAAFASVRALLKPQGLILITCPQVYPLHEEPYDFWRPTLHAIRRYAECSGLEVVELRALGTAYDVLGTVLAAMHFEPSGPSLLARGATVATRVMRRLLYATLKRRRLQSLVHVGSRLYQANLAVLRRG